MAGLLDLFKSIPGRMGLDGARQAADDDREYQEAEEERKRQEDEAKRLADARQQFDQERTRIADGEARQSGMLEQARARFDALKTGVGDAFDQAGTNARGNLDAFGEAKDAVAATVKEGYGSGDRAIAEMQDPNNPLRRTASAFGEAATQADKEAPSPGGLTGTGVNPFAPPDLEGMAKRSEYEAEVGDTAEANLGEDLEQRTRQFRGALDRSGASRFAGEIKRSAEAGIEVPNQVARGEYGQAALGAGQAAIGLAGAAYNLGPSVMAETAKSAGLPEPVSEAIGIGQGLLGPGGAKQTAEEAIARMRSYAEAAKSLSPEDVGVVKQGLGLGARMVEGGPLRGLFGTVRSAAPIPGAVAGGIYGERQAEEEIEARREAGKGEDAATEALRRVSGALSGVDTGVGFVDLGGTAVAKGIGAGRAEAPKQTREQAARGEARVGVERAIEAAGKKAGPDPTLGDRFGGETPLYGSAVERTPEDTERKFGAAGEPTTDLRTGELVPAGADQAEDVQRPRKVIERELGQAAGAVRKAGVDPRTGAGADASPEARSAYDTFRALQAEKDALDVGRGERRAEATANLDAEGRDVRTGLFPGQTKQGAADVPGRPSDLPYGGRGGYNPARFESGRGMGELDSLVGDLGQEGTEGTAAAFFSRLKNVVDRLPDRNDPAQLLQRLDASSEVANEEVTWTGLEDLLQRRANEGATVTRAEMQSWLENNRIVIAEKPRGLEPGDPALVRRREALEAAHGPANQAYLDAYDDLVRDGQGVLAAAEPAVQRMWNAQQIDRDRWHGRSAPGPVDALNEISQNRTLDSAYALELYRQHMAPAEQAKLDALVMRADVARERFNDIRADLAQARRAERQAAAGLKGGKPKWAGPASSYQNYALPGHSEPGADYREFLVMLAPRTGAGGMPDQQYRTHWAENNVVGFFRTSTRYTPDGKKTLVVEEMQSDWHQKGRKHGYAQRRPLEAIKAAPEYAQFHAMEQAAKDAREALADYAQQPDPGPEAAYKAAADASAADWRRAIGERFGFDPADADDVVVVVNKNGGVVQVFQGRDFQKHNNPGLLDFDQVRREGLEEAQYQAGQHARELENQEEVDRRQGNLPHQMEIDRIIREEPGVGYMTARRRALERFPYQDERTDWFFSEKLDKTLKRLADTDPEVNRLLEASRENVTRWQQERQRLEVALNHARDEIEFAEGRAPDVALQVMRERLEMDYQERQRWLETDVRALMAEGQRNGWLTTTTQADGRGRPLDPVDFLAPENHGAFFLNPDGPPGDLGGVDLSPYPDDSPQQAWLRKVGAATLEEVGNQRSMQRQESMIARVDREMLQDMVSGGKQPGGPFQETWQPLLAKRLLQVATQGDWEGLAWTRGEVHADRYDPSQLLAHAAYETFPPYRAEGVAVEAGGIPDGRLHLVFDNGQDRYVDIDPSKGDPVAQMGEYIGEDAARKLMEREAASRQGRPLDQPQAPGRGEMAQDELGELYVAGPTRRGLQKFYNETLPDILTKLAAPAGMRYEGLKPILQFPDKPPDEEINRPTEGGRENWVPNAELVHFMSIPPGAKDVLARQPLLMRGAQAQPEGQPVDDTPEPEGNGAIALPARKPTGVAGLLGDLGKPGLPEAGGALAGAAIGQEEERRRIEAERALGDDVGLAEEGLRRFGMGALGALGGTALVGAGRRGGRGPGGLIDVTGLNGLRGAGSAAANRLEPGRGRTSEMALKDLRRGTATGAENVRTSLGGQPLPEGEGFLDQPQSRRAGGVLRDAPPAGTLARKVWDAFEAAQAKADASGNPDDAWDVDMSAIPVPKGSTPTPVKDLIAQAKAGWDGRYWYEEMNDLLRQAVGKDADPRQLEELEVLFGNFGQQTFPLNNIQYALAGGLIRSEMQKTPGLWEWFKANEANDDSRDAGVSPRALIYEMMVGKGTGPVPNPVDPSMPLPRYHVPGIMGMEGILDRLVSYWRTGRADIGAGTKLSNYQGDVQGARTGVGSFLSTPDRHEFNRHGLKGAALEQDTAAAQYVIAMNQNLALRHPDFKGHLPRHVQAAGWLEYRRTLAGMAPKEMDKGDPAKIAANANVKRLMGQYRQAVTSGDLGILDIPYGEGLTHDTSGKQQANMGAMKGLRTGNRSGSVVRVGQREAANAQAPRVALEPLTAEQVDGMALEPVSGVPGAGTETIYHVPALGRTPHEALRVDEHDVDGNLVGSRVVVRLPAADAQTALRAAQDLHAATGVQTSVLVPDLDPSARVNTVVLELPEGASVESRAELASVLGADVAARAYFDGTRAWWPDADDALADMIVDRAASVGLGERVYGAAVVVHQPGAAPGVVGQPGAGAVGPAPVSAGRPAAGGRRPRRAGRQPAPGQPGAAPGTGAQAGVDQPGGPGGRAPAGEGAGAEGGAQPAGGPGLGDQAESLGRGGYTPEGVAKANRSSRRGGGTAPGSNPVAYRAMREAFTPEQAGAVLDFGAGKTAAHTATMRDAGYDVTAHEFGGNQDPDLHDVDALKYEYDTVVAGNVLNVQETDGDLDATLRDLAGSTALDGRVIANYPMEPRYLGLTAEDMQAKLLQYFDRVERIGGRPAVPIWKLEGPKVELGERPLIPVREAERLAGEGHFPRKGVVFGGGDYDAKRVEEAWNERTTKPRFDGWSGSNMGEPTLTVNPDGSIDVDLERWQKREQAGGEMMGGPGRGPFYGGLLQGKEKSHYAGGSTAYQTGGPMRDTGRTRFYRPLVVGGANVAGTVHEAVRQVYMEELRARGLDEAEVQRLGKGNHFNDEAASYNPELAARFDALPHEKGWSLHGMFARVADGHPVRRKYDPPPKGWQPTPDDARVEQYVKLMVQSGMAEDAARASAQTAVRHSPDGFEEQEAVQEAIVGHLLREAGFDAVVILNSGSDGRIKEVMDLREGAYPGEGGEFTLHPKFVNAEAADAAERGPLYWRQALEPTSVRKANASADRAYASAVSTGAKGQNVADLAGHDPKLVASLILSDNGRIRARFMETVADAFEEIKHRLADGQEGIGGLREADAIRMTVFAGELLSGDRVGGLNSRRPGRPDEVRVDVHALLNQIVHQERVKAERAGDMSGGINAADVAVGLANRLYANLIHETVHAHVSGHGDDFDSYLVAYTDALNDAGVGGQLRLQLHQALQENNHDVVRAIFEENATLASDPYAGPWEPGRPAGADARAIRQQRGEQRLAAGADPFAFVTRERAGPRLGGTGDGGAGGRGADAGGLPRGRRQPPGPVDRGDTGDPDAGRGQWAGPPDDVRGRPGAGDAGERAAALLRGGRARGGDGLGLDLAGAGAGSGAGSGAAAGAGAAGGSGAGAGAGNAGGAGAGAARGSGASGQGAPEPTWNTTLQNALKLLILFTPKGWARQGIGNALGLLWAPYERGGAARMASVFDRGGTAADRPVTGEGWQMLQAWFENWGGAWGEAKDSFMGRSGGAQAANAAAMGIANTNNPGTGVKGFLNRATDRGYGIIGMFDVLAKRLAQEGEARALGYREDVYAGGTGANARANTERAQQALQQAMAGGLGLKDAIASLPDADQRIVTGALRSGDYRTLTQELDAFGQWIEDGRNLPGGVGKYIVPFWKVPYNGMRYDLERSPLGLIGAIKGSTGDVSRHRQGGATEMYERWIRSLTGTLMTTALVKAVIDGYATGPEPSDTAEKDAWRAEGKTPYSLLIGGRWIPMAMFPGVNASLVQAGNAGDFIRRRHLSQEPWDADALYRIANRTVTGTISAIATKPFFDQLANVLENLGESDEAGDRGLGGLATDVASGFAVPGIVRDWERATDDTDRAPRHIGERLLGNIPGLSGNVPARRDVYGNVKRRTGSGIERLLNPLTGRDATPGNAQRRFVGSTGGEMDTAIAQAKKVVDAYDKDPYTARPPTERESDLATYGPDDWTRAARAEERERLKEEKAGGRPPIPVLANRRGGGGGGGGIPVARLVGVGK